MLKKSLVVINLMVLLILLSACAENLTGKSLSFADLASEVGEGEYAISEQMYDLDGEIVEMEGYMSTLTPLDIEYFYLTANPGIACPFCDGEDVNFFSVVQVYFPEAEGFRFSREAQRVVGYLEVGEKVDQYGARSMFRIEAQVMEKAY